MEEGESKQGGREGGEGWREDGQGQVKISCKKKQSKDGLALAR